MTSKAAGADPITVSIRREVDPGRADEAMAWVQEGLDLAHHYPGFLGSGWVRAGERSTVWHMLYRFANEETLDAWERSPERRSWLQTGASLVRDERARRRTGIEGWFDDAPTGSIPSAGSATSPPPPPRWKQAVSIWLGFLPVNLLFMLLLDLVPGWSALPLALRVLIASIVLIPLMVYVVLPFVTRSLRSWLTPG